MDPNLVPLSILNWLAFAALIVIASLTAFGAKGLINLLKSNLKATHYEVIRKWAKTYAAALIQDPTLKGLATAEKKERAMMWLISKALELGIELSVDEASRIIEEAVYLLKTITLENVEVAVE